MNYLKNKISCIIEVRSTSSRLPNKHFYRISNKPILEIMVERIKKENIFNKIIIVTTLNREDDQVESLCKKLKIFCFRGSEFNVTQRVLLAAKKYNISNICTITGDCPIIDTDLVRQAINTFFANKSDYLNNEQFGLPDGMGCQVFKFSSLKKSYKMIKKKDEFEHVTLCIRRNPTKFKNTFIFPHPKNFAPDLAVTLDEYEDYLLLKKIILFFWKKKLYKFNCKDVIQLLNKKKNWAKVTNKIIRKTKFIKLKY